MFNGDTHLGNAIYSPSMDSIPQICTGDLCCKSKFKLFKLPKHFDKYGCTEVTFLLFARISNNSSLLKK